MGCDGRCWRQASLLAGRNAAADGEVVWSWRRDRGVYPARLCGLGNGDKNRRSPGRSRISRKPLRGESRAVLAVPVVQPVCSLPTGFAHGTAGAVGARLSLRPLQREEGQLDCRTPVIPRRENESARLHRCERLVRRSRATEETKQSNYPRGLRWIAFVAFASRIGGALLNGPDLMRGSMTQLVSGQGVTM